MFRFLRLSIILAKYGAVFFLARFKLAQKPGPKTIRKFFEGAGGSFVKFGQLLALRVDVLPPAYALELIDLFDDVGPFPYDQVEQIFHQELGTSPKEIFQYFNPDPIASASFGQVHRAKLDSGEEVAVKVQRPGIARDAKVDFTIIKLLSHIADLFFQIEAIPWKQIAHEFKAWTQEELDYRIEAERAERIYQNVTKRNAPDVVIPKTYHYYTTQRTLVQDYLEGIPLTQILREAEEKKLNQERLDELGIDPTQILPKVVTEITTQYFFDGLFHADPHPGNILLMENGKLGLIDFGIVGEPAPRVDDFRNFVKHAAWMQYDKASYHFLKFASTDLERMLSSAVPASVNPKLIDDLIVGLSQHLGSYMNSVQSQIWNDLAAMKIDYSVMVLQTVKYTQRYNIRLPNEIIVFIRALSIIGFLAKRIDSNFKLRMVVRRFFEKYPDEAFPQHRTSQIHYSRMNREVAIEKLNNWLSFLVERDPELYRVVNDSVGKAYA